MQWSRREGVHFSPERNYIHKNNDLLAFWRKAAREMMKIME